MLNIDILMREAMRAKQPTILSVLRGIKTATAALLSAKGRNGKPLTNDEQISIIRKQVSQRDDSIKSFYAAGRDELAQAEEREKAILEAFLPAPMSDEDLRTLIDAVLIKTGATTRKDMGAAMAYAKELADGRVDPKVLSQLIASKLS